MADRKIYFATDIHGSEMCIRKFLNAAKFYGYEKGWASYVDNLVGCVALPCGHYPAEQAPDETYAELRKFFSA